MMILRYTPPNLTNARLALRAEVGAATCHAGLFDHSTAARAGLTLAAKDIGELQIAPPFALGVDVVSISTAAFVDTEIHHRLDTRQELTELRI